MKVAFFGNVTNIFYSVVKMLRQHTDIDAHLFVDTKSDWSMKPESDDPSIKNNYPDWIHSDSYFSSKERLFPWKSKIIKEINEFDCLVTCGQGLTIAPFVKIPYAFFVMGSDLTVSPFPLRFLKHNKTLPKKVNALIKGHWYRKGIRESNKIWGQNFYPFANCMKSLGLSDKSLAEQYLPIIIDPKKFCYTPPSGYIENIVNRIKLDSDFVLFHPSRLMMKKSKELVATGQWKRNDLLFSGFARFVKSLPINSRPLLVLPEREDTEDQLNAKRIINELKINKYVLWIHPQKLAGFTRDELIPIYSAAHVVADDFGVGWIGNVVLESLSIGIPVITHIDDSVMSKMYPWTPILSASTEKEIASHLTNLYMDRQKQIQAGKKSRDWIVEFHSPSAAAPLYEKHLELLLNQ